MSNKRKLLLEVDVETEETAGGGVFVRISHPDLGGDLHLKASTVSLMEVQLNHIRADKNEAADPLHILIDSANKLVEGVTQLKETLKKN